MPDNFDLTGLQVKTLTELKDELIAGLKAIYGNDINVDQNSPDGQQVNLYAQAAADLRELLLKINSGFDPEQAEGVVLDQRAAINNIQRQEGTFTLITLTIIIDRAVSFQGLDSQLNIDVPTNNPYAVKDNAGTQYYLVATQTPGTAGTYTYQFRAANRGVVQTTINTITTPVTVLAGVVSINNPNAPDYSGFDTESDQDFKIRRKQSTSLSAIGFLDSLASGLGNIDNVTEVQVYENNTSSVDSNGIPANGIWCIVDGGIDNDIANMIYAKRSHGTPMKGSTTISVVRPNGNTIAINFDRPINQNLYIHVHLVLPNGYYDSNAIKNSIVNNIFFAISGNATTDVIIAYLKSLDPKYLITGCQVSKDNTNWYDSVTPTSPQYRFVNSTTRITFI